MAYDLCASQCIIVRTLFAGLVMAILTHASVNAGGLFVDVTVQAGIIYLQGVPVDPLSTPEVTGMTGGAAAGDFDGDGWVDLFVTRSNATDILYRNLGNGQFADVTTAAFGSTPINVPTNGAAWGDMDNDGDLDLYVTTVGHTQHLMYINQGNGTFSEQASFRGTSVGSATVLTHGTGIAMGDYDRDGYLDIFVGEWRPYVATGVLQSRLLHNRGNQQPGSFVDTTESAGVSLELTSGPNSGTSYSFSPRFADLDGDRNLDLAITSDFGTSRLFWNNGPGAATQFVDGTSDAGIATGRNDMGSTIGDINGDGRLDWFITDIYRDALGDAHPNGNRMFQNNGNRQFTDITDSAGLRNGDWGWGTAMFDYDNDGDLDITMTNGFIDGDQFYEDRMRLFENGGIGQFTEVGSSVGVDDTGQGRGLLTFDYDRDGDLDLFVVNNGQQPVLLRNDSSNSNGFLRIRAEGSLSNRDGIGTLIRVTPDNSQPDKFTVWEVNAGTHYLAQSEFTAHFGLSPDVTSVDEIFIFWPSGIQQKLVNLAANTAFTMVEVSGDFDADGQVGRNDLMAWQQGFGQTSPGITLASGDVEGDEDVDGNDFLYWQRGYGASAIASNNLAAQVPESTSATLLGLGAMMIGGRLRRW